MQIIDYVIIGIVVLASLIGLGKGFFKTLISFFGWIVSFIIAFLLTKIVAEALLDVQFFKDLILSSSGTSLYTFISGILPENLGSGSGVDFILKPFLDLVLGNADIMAGSTADIRVATALLLTNSIFSVMVCISLFIAIRIVLCLFTMFANAITQGKFMGAINRLLGFVLGAAKGLFNVVVIMVIMCFLMPMGFMAPVQTQIDNSLIAKPLSEQVFKFTKEYLTGDDNILKKLLNAAGYMIDAGTHEMTEKEQELYTELTGYSARFSENDYIGTEYKKHADDMFNYMKSAAAKVKNGDLGTVNAETMLQAIKSDGVVFEASKNAIKKINTVKVLTNNADTAANIAAAVAQMNVALEEFNTALTTAGFEPWAGLVTFDTKIAEKETKAAAAKFFSPVFA